MNMFTVIIVEDVPLEMRGTESIIRSDIPEAEIIGKAASEQELRQQLKERVPDLVLLDLGLGGSTTIGVDLCREIKSRHPQVRVLIFTGELNDEQLWVDALDAGADGIILKCGEMLTASDVRSVMEGRHLVFNEAILTRIVESFKAGIRGQNKRQEAFIRYEIDEYDERFLRHLALGYTKEQIAALRGMPFGVKSLEKRQMELVRKLFPNAVGGINATRLAVRALELKILDIDSLQPDE